MSSEVNPHAQYDEMYCFPISDGFNTQLHFARWPAVQSAKAKRLQSNKSRAPQDTKYSSDEMGLRHENIFEKTCFDSTDPGRAIPINCSNTVNLFQEKLDNILQMFFQLCHYNGKLEQSSLILII